MALKILHIDSSPRGAASHSRQINLELVESLTKANPGASVTYRDVGHEPPPFVDEAWTEAAFLPPSDRTPEQVKALQVSEELVDELLSADVLVVGIPMYNFNVPAQLKAWIDQIVRPGRTFVVEPQADGTNIYKGLAAGKKIFIVTSRGGGGYGAGEAMAGLNHQDSFLETVLGFIGITDVEFIHVNNTAKGDEAVRESVGSARRKIQQTLTATV